LFDQSPEFAFSLENSMGVRSSTSCTHWTTYRVYASKYNDVRYWTMHNDPHYEIAVGSSKSNVRLVNPHNSPRTGGFVEMRAAYKE
jgi:hypothetical protein